MTENTYFVTWDVDSGENEQAVELFERDSSTIRQYGIIPGKNLFFKYVDATSHEEAIKKAKENWKILRDGLLKND